MQCARARNLDSAAESMIILGSWPRAEALESVISSGAGYLGNISTPTMG